MLRHALYTRVTLRHLFLPTRRCFTAFPSSARGLLSGCPYHLSRPADDTTPNSSNSSSCPVIGPTPPLSRCPMERVCAESVDANGIDYSSSTSSAHVNNSTNSHTSNHRGVGAMHAPGSMGSCPAAAGMNPGARCYTPTLWQMTQVMGKSQLSAYVAATALAGYVLAGGTSILLAGALTLGTLLQSYSANTANQILEVAHDKRMKRTCRRPLPMGHVSRATACGVACVELLAGTGVLYVSVGAAVAGLGVVNWLLYVAMYTPLKRVSAVNTWFGSIVGGVPPAMGALAAVGQMMRRGAGPDAWLSSASSVSIANALAASGALAGGGGGGGGGGIALGSWLMTSTQSLLTALSGPAGLLVVLLVVWQVPHFNGLSFHCRRDYEAAGFKMLAFYNPWRASFYAVALSLLMAGMTLLAPSWWLGHGVMPVEGVWYYPVVAAVNAVMVYKSVLFHRDPTRHCRGCFVFSYLYLSVMLVVLMLNHLQPWTTLCEAVERVGRGGGQAMPGEEKSGEVLVTPRMVESCET